MPTDTTYLKQLLARLGNLREEAGISAAALEERLILGPGWVERFERGESIPSLDMLLAMLHVFNRGLGDLLADLPSHPDTAEIERHIYAEQRGEDLLVHFRYANHDSTYTLPSATSDEFEEVIKTLRNGLSELVTENPESELRSQDLFELKDEDISEDRGPTETAVKTKKEAIKTKAVTQAYLQAVRLWPTVNPSDLWWFVIYRAYCDPFNHPATYARLDFPQSWKRTGGWALEEVLVLHYGSFLEERGVKLQIAPAEVKEQHLKTLKVGRRLESEKMDVLLFGKLDDREILFGVLHVKASFAERRSDDVPMSKALVDAGYVSPLWTMDCKSTPSVIPFNKGELGAALDKSDKKDKRSSKRKDIEEDAYFSACFSYNSNTNPTPPEQDCKARIYVCNFQNPDDAFSNFIVTEWQAFLERQKLT